MTKTIAIVQGHPDPDQNHLCHALAEHYRSGAEAAGHKVVVITLSQLDFPLLRSATEFNQPASDPAIVDAQTTLQDAQHWVLIYPLWLGTMPALMKAFLEQLLRPGFAFRYRPDKLPEKQLVGKSARIVVTMGMPAFAYRWFFRAHSLKSLERNILKFCGIRPVRHTLLGAIENASAATKEAWLGKLESLGNQAL